MKRSQKSQKKKGNPPRKQTSVYAPEPLRRTYAEGYLTSLIEDAVRLLPGRYSNADATRDISRLKDRLRSEGSGFVTKVLPSLMTGLLTLLENGTSSFPQFRLKRGTEYPVFLNRLFHLALYSTDTGERVKATDLLYSISVAFKKLKGDYPVSVIRKLFADFVATDVELGKLDFLQPALRPILEDARAQVRIFVAETDLAGLIERSTPQPGPGATNRPTKKSERYRPHTLYKQVDDVMDYTEWFYPTPMHVFQSDFTWSRNYATRINSPTARFKAVPKTVGKPRGICIEENEVQCLQQAVRKALYKAIETHFGDNIALRKQAVNATLALQSSKSRKHATIDESEASDRILRDLVGWLFQDNQEVCKLLMGLSTRWVVPPDEVKDEYNGPVKTQKYAPMGSALCFPVMSIVHMVLIRSIIRLSTEFCTRQACSEVFVYGDDIILPVEYTELIYDLLPKFGMKINKGKSFHRSYFRESCGVHALHGVDITPVYVKYIPFHRSPDALASVFAVEEQLFNKGFTKTAEFQRSYTEEALEEHFEYVPCGLSLAGYARIFDDVQLDLFKKKHTRGWSRTLQCRKLVLTRFKKRIEKTDVVSQLDAYTRWMWEGHEGSETVSDSVGTLIIVRRTVPESALGITCNSRQVEVLCKRHPVAGAGFKPSPTFGMQSRYSATADVRFYL